MKVLNLTLKKKWFDMILSGEKKDEYREIKDYWARRLLDAGDYNGIEWQAWEEMLGDLRQPFKRHTDVVELMAFFDVKFKNFDAIRFRNGYVKDAPEFMIELNGIDVKTGREKWGAEKGRFYFSLRLGNLLKVARAA